MIEVYSFPPGYPLELCSHCHYYSSAALILQAGLLLALDDSPRYCGHVRVIVALPFVTFDWVLVDLWLPHAVLHTQNIGAYL